MTDVEIELAQSAYRLRMAAQVLSDTAPSLSAYLKEQAEKNIELLKPIGVR
jgi:hypothetical protein